MKLHTLTSFDRLISLIKSAQEKQPITPQRASELVLQANVQLEDLMYYADFKHPVEDCYGRKMVHDGGWFEVMVMSWNPGDYSSIHNHGYTEWGVVQVFGYAHHLMYCIKDEQLRFSKKEILGPGAAVKVNNALIHQMGNSTSTPYLSLHVYGSSKRASEVTADAKNFDLEFNRVAHTNGGAFFNLPEDEIYDIDPGVAPTPEVFMHYAHGLLAYYNRQETSLEMVELKKQLLEQMSRYSL